jgi:plasmid stabilization system protein ParE
VKRARFTEHARAEFLAEIAYYETLRVGLGTRFRADVESVAERAATFPESGAPSPARTRKRLLQHFPFSLVYAETEYGILIHAVMHNRRLPEYWVARVTGSE